MRLISVSPSKPILVLPHGSWLTPRSSNGTVTGLDTPLMVRLPVTLKTSPLRSTAVEVKVRVGFASTLRKSGDFRWASRSAFEVSMLAAWIVSWALDAPRFASSIVNWPSNSPKLPRTFATMAWRAVKAMLVWAGSMTQVPVMSAIGGSSEVVEILVVEPTTNPPPASNP